MRQNFHRDDDNDDNQKKKNQTFVVATDSKRDLGGVLTNIPDVFFTEKEDLFVDMDKLAGCHHMIITISTYGWWAAWLGSHKIEGGVVIYQGGDTR